MNCRYSVFAASLACLVVLTTAGPIEAEPGGDNGDTVSSRDGKSSSDGSSSSKSPTMPSDPRERLELAEEAFNSGEFDRLPPLLRPVLEPEPAFEDEDNRIRARELLGVGLFFAAQSVTNPKERDKLMSAAREQFLELLRERPDYQLDPLIFPASVVELFDAVREEHAGELAKIRARQEQTNPTNSGAAEILYIERSVQEHIYFLNFMPFGMGQFQNDDQVKGTLFATGQGAALAVNITGTIIIESLRQPESGLFTQNGDLTRAQTWNTVRWSAVGMFAGLWVWSALDSLVNYRPTEVHIRTLDEPPPELKRKGGRGPSASSGGPPKLRPRLRIGFGTLNVRW